MKRRSKATLYRQIKRGTEACLELSQDYLFDDCFNSTFATNNTESKCDVTITDNFEESQVTNSDTSAHNNSDVDHLNLYDSSSQSSCNIDNINEYNVPINLNIDIAKDNIENFIYNLRSWAILHNIPHNALRDLLKLLQSIPENITVPQDPRTLLYTPRHISYKSVPPGIYSHIGITTAVEKLINLSNTRLENINLLINIDGLPLSKSSSSQVYPILCSIVEYPQNVSIIGIYHGDGKPANANDLLSDFVEEAITLCEQGFTYNNRNIPFAIKAFICDAPAKSFITYCKSHVAFFSCTKCMQKGKHVKGRVCYPKVNYNKRTNENFRSKVQLQHHTGTSILEKIPSIDMVNSFPLEYMHLVCLGVMKKLLLNIWLSVPHKLPKIYIQEISNYLTEIKSCIPSDFVRKTRSLDEVKRWKATEFRFFLLYCGPVILKNFLSSDKYLHFMSLHIAIRILLSADLFVTYLDYAQSLLQYFVKQFIFLYGPEYISHNVHGLLHIADDCRFLGNLETYSAFAFENYLQYVKKLVRKPNAPLPQILKRIHESQHVLINKPLQRVEMRMEQMHYDGPLLAGNFCAQYKKFTSNNISFSTRYGDNCCYLKDKSIILIENFAQQGNNYYIIGRKFINVTNFILQPFQSSKFDIYSVNILSELLMWPVQHVSKKFVILPYNNVYVVLPLIHTLC